MLIIWYHFLTGLSRQRSYGWGEVQNWDHAGVRICTWVWWSFCFCSRHHGSVVFYFFCYVVVFFFLYDISLSSFFLWTSSPSYIINIYNVFDQFAEHAMFMVLGLVKRLLTASLCLSCYFASWYPVWFFFVSVFNWIYPLLLQKFELTIITPFIAK